MDIQNKKPIWILFCPRSGSTYFSEFFNMAGLFPPIREYYNDVVKNKISKQFYPINNRLSYITFVKISRIWGIGFQDIIKNLPDNTRWIYLRRKNELDRLTSLCIQRLIKRYCKGCRTHPEKFEKIKDIKIEPDEVSKMKFLFKKNQAKAPLYWGHISEVYNLNIKKIFYEDMNLGMIEELFEFCGFTKEEARKVYSMNPIKRIRDIIPEKYEEVKKILKKEFDKMNIKI